MKETRWTEGWHYDGKFQYYIEDGIIVRGIADGTTVYPYHADRKNGGYKRVIGLQANKRNYESVWWF